jgi:hypothetical protein
MDNTMNIITVDEMLVEALLNDSSYIILADFFSCHNEVTNKKVADDFLQSGMTIDDYLATDRYTNIILDSVGV